MEAIDLTSRYNSRPMRLAWCALLLTGCQGEPVVAAPATDSAVEVELDSGVDSSLVDSTTDSGVPLEDSAVAETVDSTIDSGVDSTIDAAPETAPEAAADTTLDVAGDAAASDPQCGTHKAGPMVYTGAGSNFCIDAREVNRREYLAFVADGIKPAAPAYCDWNTSFTPMPSGLSEDHPITGIDFCDAVTFCEWAGKHICGSIADGKPTGAYDASSSQWMFACVGGGTPGSGVWSTGAAPPTAGMCNIGTGTGPVVVDAHPACVGTAAPWNRVRNLTGNVAEWDASGCFMKGLEAGTTPANRDMIDCAVRGGYHGNSVADGKCVLPTSKMIDEADTNTGFRCCKGPFI